MEQEEKFRLKARNDQKVNDKIKYSKIFSKRLFLFFNKAKNSLFGT